MLHSDTRPPAVSGLFYPQDRAELRASVCELLEQAPGRSEQKPRAIIAPHAGLVYSGPVAASAYAQLRGWTEQYRRVVLIGPSHRVAFHGIATPGCNRFATPLGEIELDSTAIEYLARKTSIFELPSVHANEHSLEVHLPSLQILLKEFLLVPLVVGDASTEVVAGIFHHLWQDETLFVVSSDLSHYLPYDMACERDRETSERIVHMSGELDGDQACGCRPINGLMQFCHRRGLSISTVDLRNSGDTSGDLRHVVGYGGYVIH